MPVNLNRVRKERARAKKRAEGDENAAKFGRTKAQKRAEEADRARTERHLDGHKRGE